MHAGAAMGIFPEGNHNPFLLFGGSKEGWLKCLRVPHGDMPL